MTEKKEILKVDDLSLWVRNGKREIQILHHISFGIREGERWAIAGESGAGKSMTMNAVTALLPEGSVRTEGRILFADEGGWRDLLSMPYAKRHAWVAKKVAVIFQDSINALNPNERIGRQWRETVQLHSQDMSEEEMTEHLLERMKIFGIHGGEGTLRQYPDQLSGGMRQRIAIAMALESPAGILIADEPTTSLDAITQRSTVDFIKDLLDRDGRTLLYISHNLGILQYMCDHVLILKDGRVVEQGTAQEVLCEGRADYTRELVRETLRIMGKKRDE